ncbi:BatA domain-containing protein [Blastopirellula marina]|uniref:Inter-alpha-trypsin inhibitor heavy chain H2-like protein n=1 Tax=Blastopirellula marina DSM 3645 TaxID=314230 RepID=A3ZY71_9BACT|nr:BatA domain-containing protein [Blastopirellula marina]EAQ78542.1 inter-alpha-trypsin inhibitor heavy chain H2 precursor-like protein [Blastopirellula marina DSM 3645]
MSLLYGAFLLGALTIAAPLLFHLIRRTPKARYEFSSLMFLQPSPPRLTRRSRLDEWLLLLLRALAILLLAFAFTRPYFRTQAELSLSDAPQRHVAILVDHSASMRRGAVWDDAITAAKEVIDGLEPTDEVSLFAFDEKLEMLVAPESLAGFDQNQRRQLVRNKLAELSPTWGASDLGSALLGVAERLESADDLHQTHAALQIVLVGDVQAGSQLDALQTSQWPESVRLEVHNVIPADISNARVRLIASQEEETDGERVPRVRVRNVAGSQIEQFEVVWKDGAEDRSRPVSFYVPPGESLVLDVPLEIGSSSPDRLLLRGDGPGLDFDNTFYQVPAVQEQISLAYFGSDAADDPEQMRFYLSRAFDETPARKIEIAAVETEAMPNWEIDAAPYFAVIAHSLSQTQQDGVNKFLEQGGDALVVLSSDDMVREMGAWLGGVQLLPPSDQNSAAKDSFALLGYVDFQHPLFVPFAGARYNDFTKIRFWRHRQVNLDEVKGAAVIARFSDDTPALWSIQRGEGTLYVMSAGWSRADSQLALSTKFLPLLSRWLELAAKGRLASQSYVVNQPVPLPTALGKRVVQTPTGDKIELAEQDTVFAATLVPGIYSLLDEGQETKFAVNVADSESETDPLDLQRLEQFDIALGAAPSQTTQLDRMRQLRDLELENRQKIWKWLIVAVLILLGVETWLAARRSRQPVQVMGDLA